MSRTGLAYLVAAALLAGPLAGCIGGSDTVDWAAIENQGLSVTVSPPEGSADTNFTFDATGTPTADPLTFHWEFGDGANATGDVVHHVFRYTDKTYQVHITATDGNRSLSGTLEVPVGDGENEDPEIEVDAAEPWIATGDPVQVNATVSDPDGDDVTVRWLTAKKLVRPGGDSGDEARDFEAPDFEAPEETGKTGETTNLRFSEAGTYKIIGEAIDPKGGESEASVTVKVTRTVPKTTFTLVESNTLQGGTASGQTGTSASETLYGVQQPNQNTYIDAAIYNVQLVYPGNGTFSLNWSDPAGTADLDLFLENQTGGQIVALDEFDPMSSSTSTTVSLPDGGYTIIVRANEGSQIDYTVTLDLDLKIPGLTVGVD